MTDDADHPDLRSRDVPFREDMAYQLKVWRFERCGWYALVLLMVLAMAGLFSRGLISSRDVRSEDGQVRVQYEMFHRNGSTNSMRISLTAAPEATVELELAGDLLQGFSIDTLQPEPLPSRSAAEGVRFWLQADKQGQVSLYLSMRGDGLGLYRSHISTPGSSGVTLSQFIFP
ncbi:hypothetical protein ACTJKS_17900 [Pseudomonas sp. 22189]|uniref:hypothetical protein n=1 Tax=Pseudomonas sp. 22189 TaxID=3453889 RepID=UPI003F82CEFD